jgi:hypothetical protein
LNGDHADPEKATLTGGLFAWGVPVLLVDSITEALTQGAGCVAVSGSHGGMSSARYALQARPLLAVFNDAGVGRDGAGIAALPFLQGHGIAACTVAHDSARIGQARSTWEDGVLSHANEAATALGARPGRPLREWLLKQSAAESSPAHR